MYFLNSPIEPETSIMAMTTAFDLLHLVFPGFESKIFFLYVSEPRTAIFGARLRIHRKVVLFLMVRFPDQSTDNVEIVLSRIIPKAREVNENSSYSGRIGGHVVSSATNLRSI